MPDELRKPAAPAGLALYLRAMSRSTIRARVKRMADHGLRWAAIGGPWQTGDEGLRMMNAPEVCREIAEVLREHGLKDYVWGYPARGRHVQFADLMAECALDHETGFLADPELEMKTKRNDPDFDELSEVVDAAHALFWELVKRNPYRQVAMTSYGQVKGHPTFPWEGFLHKEGFDPLKEVDWNSPQLYDQPLPMIEKGLREWRDEGADVIVPSYGTYRFGPKDAQGRVTYPRMTYGELVTHLTRLELFREKYKINAMIGWSEAQVSGGGWRALAECAERFATLV